ncbi:alpha/beta-hydrolase, partial [Daedalea quercina L-15889]
LTTLLPLTRFPHASKDRPLTVSLSDLGCRTGHPVVVFLGLGCVRHIMGLYDEMAECLNIRLITIDRWGLGRTDNPRNKSARGIPEWAYVVEEVLDRLKIEQCSVMAHSAGAPYALAFANRYPDRIRGEVCLLAPWVGGGEGAGYKWLKYVPNGILKTAQAAEWKIQAWVIGKPPTLQFEGIGFDANSPVTSPVASKPVAASSSIVSRSVPTSTRKSTSYLEAKNEAGPRPSISSIALSEYDDLRDFEGRFESQTSLERKSTTSEQNRAEATPNKPVQPKTSRGFLGRLKSGQPQSPQDGGHRGGTKLKVLRSMSSLKGKRSVPSSPAEPPPVPQLPLLPTQASADIGLGLDNLDLDGLDFSDTIRVKSTSTPAAVTPVSAKSPTSIDFPMDELLSSRVNGRRSISLGACERPLISTPSPFPSPIPEADSPPASFQAMLGNALVAASHAESAKGTHRDLVQILNHDRQPWGFSYAAYPHTVRVWYGDHDDRIAENAVRWMENTMGPDKCIVKVIEDADHALMYKSSVVIEVLESITEFWRDRECCSHWDRMACSRSFHVGD